MYGPASTVTTVVWNAELAQSYIVQPKISRGSLRAGIRRQSFRESRYDAIAWALACGSASAT